MTQVQKPDSHGQLVQGQLAQGEASIKASGVQVWPLVVTVLVALLIPVGLAFAADALLGTTPVIAVAASIICIPLATVLVINRTMREMRQLIAEVAPEVAPEPPSEAALELEGEAEGEVKVPQ